jgi:hypothetical protein
VPEFIFLGSVPSPAEFRQVLADAMAATNPVDDLLMLAGRLGEYERKYRMSSTSFAQRYQAGELDDEVQHCVEWATTYDLFAKTKRVVEATLMRVAVQPEMVEVMA